MVVVALALFTAIKEVIVGVTMRGINTKTIQPKTSNAKIPNPSFGRKEPDVIQANLEAGISGSKSCFHLGFRTITDDPGTCTVILYIERPHESCVIKGVLYTLFFEVWEIYSF